MWCVWCVWCVCGVCGVCGVCTTNVVLCVYYEFRCNILQATDARNDSQQPTNLNTLSLYARGEKDQRFFTKGTDRFPMDQKSPHYARCCIICDEQTNFTLILYFRCTQLLVKEKVSCVQIKHVLPTLLNILAHMRK